MKQKILIDGSREEYLEVKEAKKPKLFRDLGRRFLMSTIGGRKEFQKIFRTIFLMSCHGMNYGELGDFRKNGENIVLNYIKQKKINPIIFDVGANIGEYSNFVLNVFRNKPVNLYSFEPATSSFEILKKNTKFKIFNIGFGDKIKTSNLFYQSDYSTQASLYQRDLREYGFELNLKEKVKIDTIDNFCTKNKINNIDFLKIDAEGNELNILKGAQNMMNSGNIDCIQFETGCNIDSKTYFRDFFYLLNSHYKIYRILKNGFIEISNYGWENEIMVGANYFAIKRKS
jgi:FkbM family methyltransferase